MLVRVQIWMVCKGEVVRIFMILVSFIWLKHAKQDFFFIANIEYGLA